MDTLSDKKISRLAGTQGTTRVYEMDDGQWLTAKEGTVSWRNNNPGNLKFEFSEVQTKPLNQFESKTAPLKVHNPLMTAW